ncbi:MAG: hypothetical protein KDA85_21020, partial [Planctomycetaceae bacterium]|nr:hypothetical protein [Planctomycetaceae bacterium]
MPQLQITGTEDHGFDHLIRHIRQRSIYRLADHITTNPVNLQPECAVAGKMRITSFNNEPISEIPFLNAGRGQGSFYVDR